MVWKQKINNNKELKRNQTMQLILRQLFDPTAVSFDFKLVFAIYSKLWVCTNGHQIRTSRQILIFLTVINLGHLKLRNHTVQAVVDKAISHTKFDLVKHLKIKWLLDYE